MSDDPVDVVVTLESSADADSDERDRLALQLRAELRDPQRHMALTAVAVVATVLGAAAIRDTLDSGVFSPSLLVNPLGAVAVSALGCVIAQARPAPHQATR